jgi:hypothetical protein
MGSKSSSSGGNNNNKGYQGPKGPVAPPSIQTKKVNKMRDARIIENTVQDITRKQIKDPTRFKGSQDSAQVWNTVSMRTGNYATDSKGRPIRTSSGKIVMTSKGRKEYENAMRRIPLSKKQVESQHKIAKVLTLPLMLIPGGGLIRADIVNKQKDNVFKGGSTMSTYGGKNLLSDAEINKIARQQEEVISNKPIAPINVRSRKKKSLLSTIFGKTVGKLGSSQGGL